MELSDARSRRIVRLHRRKSRRREGLVLVEGPRAVRAALDAGVDPRFAVISPRLLELDAGLADRLSAVTEVVHVSDAEMAPLADTEAPQGVLIVAQEPGEAWLDGIGPETRLLILDGVQDPGNVGTLVRSAAAFALDGVLLLDGTADVWSPKSIRASAGALFSCPVAQRSETEMLSRTEVAGLPLLVAEATGGSVAPAHGGRGWALVIGSEGRGVRDTLRAAAARGVGIPMPGRTESLNAGVAGSILLYELTRSDGGHGA
jgi:TrmH family RNA methyltransferase